MADGAITLRNPPATLEELHERASRPDQGVIEALRACDGDVAVLGAAGKMGFHVARMAQRALETLGGGRKVHAVSRFSNVGSRDVFARHGIEIVNCDLSDARQLAALPECSNVFFLGGVKFGTADDPQLLRRYNMEMPALVAARFRSSRIVALSTGCVYPYVPPETGGSRETDATDPPGAYARSCLGRETAFTLASQNAGTRVCLIRLNYSVDLRYGVPVDIGQRILAGQTVDVSMGYVNFIWQGDATRRIVRALTLVDAPPAILNVTGERIFSVREVATRLAAELGANPRFIGEEAPTAWLNDSSKARALFGALEIDEDQLLHWVASWLRRGGTTLNKPTRFETRDGKY